MPAKPHLYLLRVGSLTVAALHIRPTLYEGFYFLRLVFPQHVAAISVLGFELGMTGRAFNG